MSNHAPAAGSHYRRLGFAALALGGTALFLGAAGCGGSNVDPVNAKRTPAHATGDGLHVVVSTSPAPSSGLELVKVDMTNLTSTPRSATFAYALCTGDGKVGQQGLQPCPVQPLLAPPGGSASFQSGDTTAEVTLPGDATTSVTFMTDQMGRCQYGTVGLSTDGGQAGLSVTVNDLGC